MPTSKQAHGQLHSGGKQAQAAHLTPTSKHPPVQLYSTSTSKPEPTQLYMTPTSKQANVKQFSTSSTSANRPLIEPLPSVTISTKSSSQTLREFRKGRPGSNPAATEQQKVVTALEAIQQRHGPAMQKVSCNTISPKYVFFSKIFSSSYVAFSDPEFWERAAGDSKQRQE